MYWHITDFHQILPILMSSSSFFIWPDNNVTISWFNMFRRIYTVSIHQGVAQRKALIFLFFSEIKPRQNVNVLSLPTMLYHFEFILYNCKLSRIAYVRTWLWSLNHVTVKSQFSLLPFFYETYFFQRSPPPLFMNEYLSFFPSSTVHNDVILTEKKISKSIF